jgi:hypothetical protein
VSTDPPRDPESGTRLVPAPPSPVVAPPPPQVDAPSTGTSVRPRVSRVWIARGLALVVDAVQVLLVPIFAPGLISPVNDGLDVVIGLILVRLVGWHWAFLPSFLAELVPGLDLFPSWTTAVWFATRGRPAART